jgi:hypothetical protein
MMLVTRAVFAVALCVWAFPLLARTLKVGKDLEFKLPSEAAAAAKGRRHDRDISWTVF